MSEPPKTVTAQSPQRRKSSVLSLKSIHQKLKDVDHVEETEEDLAKKPKDAFSEDDLKSYWKEFTQKLISNGEKSLASILNVSTPTVEQNIITYPLINKLMKDQFITVRPRLLKHLRNSLNNYAIKVEIVIVASTEKKHVYTIDEKFEKLVEINPDVQLLKEMFNLDL